MKRNYLLCALALTILLLGGCAREQEQMTYIGAENAKQAALDASGLTATGVESITADLSTRDGTDYYQVEFTAAGQSYQYDIDALTGVVIEARTPTAAAEDGQTAGQPAQTTPETPPVSPAVDSQTTNTNTTGQPVQAASETRPPVSPAEDGQTANKNTNSQPVQTAPETRKPVSSPAAGSGTGTGTADEMITADQAKEKALAHAGLTADQVTFVKSRLDYENGRQVYDVEFYTGSHTEYDYEIDAYTGEVVSFDYDVEDYTAPDASSGVMITAEQAKELALAQVPGATVNDIREFETDYDDGRTEYEGKIIYDGMEYEFEIDAYSGAIRSWEAEPVGR